MISDYISRDDLLISYSVSDVGRDVSFKDVKYTTAIKELAETKIFQVGEHATGLISSVSLYYGNIWLIRLSKNKVEYGVNGVRGDLVARKIEELVTFFFKIKFDVTDLNKIYIPDEKEPSYVQNAGRALENTIDILGFDRKGGSLTFISELHNKPIKLSKRISTDDIRVSYSVTDLSEKISYSDIPYLQAIEAINAIQLQQVEPYISGAVTEFSISVQGSPFVSFKVSGSSLGVRGQLIADKIKRFVASFLSMTMTHGGRGTVFTTDCGIQLPWLCVSEYFTQMLVIGESRQSFENIPVFFKG